MPPAAKNAIPMRFIVVKSVSMRVKGQRIAKPTQEIIRLMLNGFVFLLFLPTMTTESPDIAAERMASVIPIMCFGKKFGVVLK